MRKASNGIARLSDLVNRLALWGAVAAIVIMIAAAGYQVIARYLFAAPPIWTEEVARRAMIWAGMLGASVAFHAKADPTLAPGMASLGGGIGRVAAIVRATGVCLFVCPVLYYCLFDARMNIARGFLGRSLDRDAEMLGVPMIWFTAAVPLAFLLILLHVVADLTRHLASDAATEPVPVDETPI